MQDFAYVIGFLLVGVAIVSNLQHLNNKRQLSAFHAVNKCLGLEIDSINKANIFAPNW